MMLSGSPIVGIVMTIGASSVNRPSARMALKWTPSPPVSANARVFSGVDE